MCTVNVIVTLETIHSHSNKAKQTTQQLARQLASCTYGVGGKQLPEARELAKHFKNTLQKQLYDYKTGLIRKGNM